MLTDAAIQRALKKGRNTQLSDGSGKGTGRVVLLIRSGRAEWYAQQWLNNRKRLSKLGNYPMMSLAEARKRMVEDFGEAITYRRDIRVNRSERLGTIKDLFEGYIAHLKAAGKRSYDDAEYNLHRILRHIDATKLARDYKPEDFKPYLRAVYLNGTRSMADHMRSYISAAFSWGIARDKDYRTDNDSKFLIQANPAASIPAEPKTPGHRWLNVDELRDFWRWLHVTEPYNPKAAHSIAETNLMVLRMIVLTGQRVEMICGIHADMVKGDTVEWKVTKNGLPHVLPLPEQAVRIIEAAKPNEHGWLFPMVSKPELPVTNHLIYSITQRYIQRSGCEHFTPRDLRRTWKTLAGQAGIHKERRDLIQHHARNDVSAVHYDRYEYLDEKRESMQKWSEWFRLKIESPS